MRRLLLFIALLCSHICKAQDYQCVRPGVRHYYNNAIGYLRGMRIDSVRSYTDSTIYYPFHTQRKNLGTSPSPYYDIDGGSWLGKKIIALTDGTTFFENIWKDSLVLKVHANVGDSWVFYDDTSRIYYKAYMVSRSAREIYGVTDSVKVIAIKAFDRDTGYIPSDSANNLKITISKNFGFYETFDFYLFPHRLVNSVSWGGTGPVDDYFFRQSGPQQFRHVEINKETYNDLYNFEVGDIIGYTYICSFLGYGYKATVDRIIAKEVISSTETKYTSARHDYHHCDTARAGWYESEYTAFIYGNGTLLNFVDTTLMPEENTINTMYYYAPGDSSCCFKSSKYWRRSGAIFNDFEPCESGVAYKMGFGKTNEYICTFMFGDRYTVYEGMSSYNKVASPCATSVADIGELPRPATVNVYPNPANDMLTISRTTPDRHTLTLVNAIGQVLLNEEKNSSSYTIDVSTIPPGIYMLCISDARGRYNEKISVIH